jgi:uncharacterized protein YyaL (SSP411 family)
LLRRYRDGEAAIDAFCEDYACMAWGLIELFQTTGEGEWLDWAIELADLQRERFFDDRDGGWYSTTGEDADVLLRLKEDYDGAEPSATSVTTRNLIRLAQLTGDVRFMDLAERTFQRYGAGLGQVVRVMPLMAANLALWHGRRSEVVLTGDADSADFRALERVVAGTYLPWAVTLTKSADAPAPAQLPWLAAMTPKEGRATAFVCHAFACQAPTHEPAALEEQLANAAAPSRIILA